MRKPFRVWFGELNDARYVGMSPFIMPSLEEAAGVRIQFHLYIDGSVLVATAGVYGVGSYSGVFTGG